MTNEDQDYYPDRKPVPTATGHTPGPWRVEAWSYENGKTIKTVIQNNESAVGEVWELYRPDDEHKNEKKANAALIAAAPELLVAAKYALSVLESIPEEYAECIADILDESIDCGMIELAIAKAEADNA